MHDSMIPVPGGRTFGRWPGRHLGANASNAMAVIWPDVAHMIGMEQPERLAAAILEFLEPMPRWS